MDLIFRLKIGPQVEDWFLNERSIFLSVRASEMWRENDVTLVLLSFLSPNYNILSSEICRNLGIFLFLFFIEILTRLTLIFFFFFFFWTVLIYIYIFGYV